MRDGKYVSSRSRGAPLVVASNRGPVEYVPGAAGGIEIRRSGGGLVAILGPALASSGGVWVAAATGELDRQLARDADLNDRLAVVDLPQGHIAVRSLCLDGDAFRSYYDKIANQTLWFLHHHLFDLTRSPVFGREFRADWSAYEQVNGVFSAACAEEVAVNGTVVLQDYHLAVAPALLRAQRSDVRIIHSTMSSWADPGYFVTLPNWAARRLIDGMLGADLVSFLALRWADAFLGCCADLGYDVDWSSRTVSGGNGARTAVRAAAVGVDVRDLLARLAGARGRAEIAAVDGPRGPTTRLEGRSPGTGKEHRPRHHRLRGVPGREPVGTRQCAALRPRLFLAGGHA